MKNHLKAIRVQVSIVFAVGAAAYFVYFFLQFIGFPAYIDHGVPVVVSRAWVYLNGQPLYLPPDHSEFLLVPYGPAIFQLNAWVLGLFGGTVPASKLGGILTSAATVLLFMLYVRRAYGGHWFWLGGALMMCLQLYAVPFTFWARPDPQALFLVTAALLITTFRRDHSSNILNRLLFGLCVGLAANLKIHFFIFFAPIFARHYLKDFYTSVVIMLPAAVAAFFTPFLIDGVSFEYFFAGVLDIVGVRSIQYEAMWEITKRAFVFITPVIALGPLALFRFRDVDKWDIFYFLALAASVAVTFYPSLVAGSGWYQMIPFIPITVDLILRFLINLDAHRKTQLAVMLIFVFGFSILTVTPQKRHMRMFAEKSWMADVKSELQSIDAELGDQKVQIGYGNSVTDEAYRLTWLKAVLVFNGNPLTIDAWSDGESKFSQVPISSNKIWNLASCETPNWLIPRSIPYQESETPPFLMVSFFGGTVFWSGLVDAFSWNYVKAKSYKFFDLWTCNAVG